MLGQYTTCALLDGGSVRCWGNNGDGMLGRNNTVDVGGTTDSMPPKDALLFENPP